MQTTDYHYDPARDAGNREPDGPPFDVTVIFLTPPGRVSFRCSWSCLPTLRDCYAYIIHPKKEAL